MKLLWLLALAIVACRVLFGKWPWQFAGGYRKRRDAIREARQLLGVGPEASRREIGEAHRRLVAAVHPDRGGSPAQVHEANAARDLLYQNLPLESRE